MISCKASFAGLRKKVTVVVCLFAMALSFAPHSTKASNIDPGSVQQIGTAFLLGLPPELIAYIDNLWITAWNSMRGQYSAVMMQQMFAIGTLFDGKEQLERQRVIEQLRAEAQKDYQSDHQLCRFGTNTRNLAGSEIRSDINARLLNNTLLARELLNANSAGAVGMVQDYKNRMDQFKRDYCNVQDNNNGLVNVCTNGVKRENNDISYTRFVEGHLTLDVDFTDNTLTNDEEDIIALSKNLFSHNILKFQKRELLNSTGNTSNAGRDMYQDLRSVIAMRSIARNSYTKIIGMRASGTNRLGPHMHNIISSLGIPNNELNRYLGENPSYFAQMEVLTKKIIETPTFFANLYTSPANLERTKVTLQALRLMQDRDRYESSLRRELLISMILEAKLREQQEAMSNEAMNMTDTQIAK